MNAGALELHQRKIPNALYLVVIYKTIDNIDIRVINFYHWIMGKEEILTITRMPIIYLN